jgi:hypothetical protein
METVDQVGRVALTAVWMVWVGAVCAYWVCRGGAEGCWDGAVECGGVRLGWMVWVGEEGIGGGASVAPSAT